MTNVPPAAPRPRPRAGLGKKLLFSLAAIVIALLLGEAFLRARFFLKHGTLRPVHTFARDPVANIPIPVPGRVAGGIHIDSRGFRSPELEVPKPAGRVRLAFLGASTTFCAEVSGNAATWPSLVAAEIARAHPGVPVDHVNAGVAGHVLRHMRLSLEHRLAPLAPDVIVVYEATNDLSKDSLDLAREQGVYRGHGDSQSWLAERSLLWSLIEKNVVARTRTRAGTGDAPRVQLDLPRMEASFRERYAALLRQAREIAPVVVAVTFSQATRPGLPPDELERSCVTHSYYMPYMDAEQVIASFAAYNRAIRAAAAEAGAVLIEGEDDIPSDARHFTDSVHFTDEGCRWMARRVVAGLERAPAFRALFQR